MPATTHVDLHRAPWRLLRDYFPKAVSLANHLPARLLAVEYELTSGHAWCFKTVVRPTYSLRC